MAASFCNVERFGTLTFFPPLQRRKIPTRYFLTHSLEVSEVLLLAWAVWLQQVKGLLEQVNSSF